jgi:hypothetical protein
MFIFDVETTDTESTAVVLSAGMVYVDVNASYESMVENGLFVKFNAKEQIQQYGRTSSKDTMEWWSKQCEQAKQFSLYPHENDVPALTGIQIIKDWMKSKTPNPEKEQIFIRGSLDQMVIDSLCKAVGVSQITSYNMYRDVRTAVDLLHSTAKNGYCEVKFEGFNRDNVLKHHPTADCALDAMMIVHGV